MPRDCGDCSFCCRVLGVVELKKPANQDCVYCTGTSCTVHNDPLLFPKTCRDFDCGYLVSRLPVEFRPDNCHMMITGEEEALAAHFIHVDPRYPDAPNTPIGQQLIQIVLAAGRYPNILLITDTKEKIISRNAAAAKTLRRKLADLKKQGRYSQ